MKKSYYVDYVNHILRFYYKYDKSKGFKNDVDETNYQAADKVIKQLSYNDRQLFKALYTQKDINLARNVTLIADAIEEDQKRIWSKISSVTTDIARERGLL